MKELIAILIACLLISIPVGGLVQLSTNLQNTPQVEQSVAVINSSSSTTSANVPAIATPVPSVGGNIIDNLIDFARTWLGVPYQWGGCSRKGIDCSCFVQTALASIGIHVPRTTVPQKAFDTPVIKDNLKPGDTLFFDNTCTGCGANPTHEGMYIGGGLMIQAGDPVQISSINTAYWQSHWDSAGRPPGL